MNASTSPARPINLNSLRRVARGKNRDIFFMPEGVAGHNSPLVLKVPRYADRSDRQGLLKRVLQRLFPESQRRVISNEVRYLRHLTKNAAAQASQLPIPAFYGFVDTDAGMGALWEAICREDGALAPTLEDVADAGGMAPMIAPLNAFAAACYRLNIVAPDINDRNLAVRRRAGGTELFLVDGFGDHRMISLRALWPYAEYPLARRQVSKDRPQDRSAVRSGHAPLLLTGPVPRPASGGTRQSC